MSTQYLETGFDIKGVEEDGTFSGYAGVFGNIDSHRDILMQGSTTKSITESNGRIPILADHDMRNQIGWNMKADEDSTGILVNGALNMAVQKAVEKHALAKQAFDIGAPMGLSIGYITKDYAIDESDRIRKLKEIDLKEYSFVAFPSNTRASVLSIKSFVDELDTTFEQVKNSPKQLERIFREVGFSNSESKKLATTAHGLVSQNLREVEGHEAEDVLSSFKMMNAALDLKMM